MRDADLDTLRDMLIECRDDHALRLIAEIARGKSDEPHAMISNEHGTTGVTEAIATMYDAIVNSMDWGSHFLCVEDIEALVLIGKLMKFELPAGWEDHLEKARRIRVRDAVPGSLTPQQAEQLARPLSDHARLILQQAVLKEQKP